MSKQKGIYIALEGLQGCGKSTQLKLLDQKLRSLYPQKEIVITREPGGSEIADVIRKVVQGTKFAEDMEVVCEQYLYAASRAQTLRTIVSPALKRGALVLADRSVYTSVAVQGFGRKLGPELVLKINEVAVNSLMPTMTFILDVSPSKTAKRLTDHDADKFENMSLDFFQRTRRGYRYMHTHFPAITQMIAAEASIEEVHEILVARILPILRQAGW